MATLDKLYEKIADQAPKSVQVMIDADAASYVRSRDLPKIIAVNNRELHDATLLGTMNIIEELQVLQRTLGIIAMNPNTQHCYDFNRHVAVLAALKAERATLAEIRGNVEAVE